MKRKIGQIIVSLDTAVAAAAAMGVYFFFPSEISSQLLKDILSTGISVLAIVFSIYFASMTFIISSSDDEFVYFLRQADLYDRLIWIFRWTLITLLVALFTGLIFYLFAAVEEAAGSEVETVEQSAWLAIIFVFLFTYSMIASFLTTNDAIKYAKRRARFIDIMRGASEEQNDSQAPADEPSRSEQNDGS